ncbi:MAG: ABC transporter permease [Hungatella sp.]|nr:ABC transporter permease [Hungatella sp.]
MVRYTIKRLAVGAVTLFLLATITFFLMHVIPGSPFAGETTKLPVKVLDKLYEKYGLDKPLLEQYVIYMKNAVRGDFGVSIYRKGKSIEKIIAAGLPYTVRLGAVSVCVALLMGIFLGTVAAFTKKRWLSNLVLIVATAGVSMPGFLLSVLLLLLFGVVLKWLPFVGLNSPLHYILPATGMAFAPISMIARLVRSSLREVMKQDYMVLARAKGTPEKLVIWRHGLKNAMLPVITYAGPMIATLLTGSFVIESLYSIPGIGAEFVTSITNRDYTMIMALTILYGTFIIIANIITDIVNAMIDPRIKLGK